MLCFLRSFCFLLFFTFFAAEASTHQSPVNIEILLEETSIQPGHPFSLATKFTIEEGWHIYWKNPGEAGMAPFIEWELPEGFQVNEMKWPAPKKFDTAGMVGYGYEGEATLLTAFVPSQKISENSVKIKSVINWLVCSPTSCQPGSKTIEISLNVSQQLPTKIKENESYFESEKGKIPVTKGIIKTKELANGKIQIELAADSVPENKKRFLRACFFPEENQIFDLTEEPELMKGENNYLISLKSLSKDKQEMIKGVLVLYEETKNEVAIAFEVDSQIEKEENFLIGLAATDHVKSFSIESKVVSAFEGGIGLALLFAFLGGALLNLMPCVLPVISFKVMSFVKMAGQDRKLTLKHGLFFCLGVLLSFWLLASVMLMLRAYGQTVGWGFQLQDPHFVMVLASLLFLFSLSLFGVFELGIFVSSWAGQTENDTTNKSSAFLSSFLSGVLATAVATPCTGPFLGSAVGFAVTLPYLQALLIFTSLAIGMCAPYLILAAYPSLLRFLPKPGAWMETFKQLMGFMLLATVLWLLWVFSAQTNTFSLICFLAGLLCFSFAAWIYGRGTGPMVSKNKRYLAYAVTFLILCIGVKTALYPKVTWNNEEIALLTDTESKGDGWKKFSPELIAQLETEKIPYIIDFTAKWCLICQANHMVLSGEDVEKEFSQKGIVKIKADWTKNDPEITKALSQYGRNSVPLYVMHGGNPEVSPLILPQVLTKEVIFDHIKEALSTNPAKSGKL